MDPDEIALSEVHMGRDYSCEGVATNTTSANNYQVVVTRFLFDPPGDASDSGNESGPPHSRISCEDGDGDLLVARPLQDSAQNAGYESNQQTSADCETNTREKTKSDAYEVGRILDEDGDTIVDRNKKQSSSLDVITIEHALGTRLVDVGLQVWQGCLLLCDFILDNPDVFNGKNIIELGGGVGLASIVSATTAKTVICTDIGEDVLSVCQHNVNRNSHIYRQLTADGNETQHPRIFVRELDWKAEKLPEGQTFGWSVKDKDMLKEVDIFIAADVVYDEDLTDALFQTIHEFMARPPAKVCYISLEKRLNFTLEDRDVACPAYTHYQRCLSKLTRTRWKEKVHYTSTQIPADTFKQYFHYTRNRYLELWQINSHFEGR